MRREILGISLCLGAGSNYKLNKSQYVNTQSLLIVNYLQVEIHELINSHDSSFVTTSVAVIWCAENCDYIAIVCPVISIHHELMSTGYSN